MAVVCLALLFTSNATAVTDSFLSLSSPLTTNNQIWFTLAGESEVNYVIEASSDLQSWSPVSTNSASGISRLISIELAAEATFYRVRRSILPVFNAAITAKQGIDFKGTSISVDSYDSADPAYSTNGVYDPTKRKAGGDLLSGDGLLNVQNATVKGRLWTGPTAPPPAISLGSVGDLNWNGPGIEPGWLRNDFRFAIPDVLQPFSSGLLPGTITGAGGVVTNIVGSTNYMINGNFTLRGGDVLYVSGKARVFVTGNFTMQSGGGKSSLIRITQNSTLQLFVGGANSTFTSVDTVGNDVSFQYYGLPTNTSLAWIGNSSYVGTIYAPEASVILGAGGSSAMDFQGAVVADSFSFNGHFSFHYDENLRRIGPAR